MRTRSTKNRLINVVMVAALIAPAWARAGIESESITLSVPPGARSIGMGFTGVSDAADIANAFHNPATLSLSDGIGLTGGLDNWKGDLNQFDFALTMAGEVSRFRLGGGLYHTRVESRIRFETSAFKVATNESFMTAVLGGAWIPFDRVQVGLGAATRWSTGNLFETDALFDAGVLVSATLTEGERFSIACGVGISGRNIGGGTAELTDTSGTLGAEIEGKTLYGITVSAAWRGEKNTPLRFTVNVDASDNFESPAIGGELTILETVSLRGGYGDSIFSGKHASTVGVGIGRRIDFFTLRFDYAFAEARDGAWHFNAMGTTMSFDL